jgi:hypothetical protein
MIISSNNDLMLFCRLSGIFEDYIQYVLIKMYIHILNFDFLSLIFLGGCDEEEIGLTPNILIKFRLSYNLT